MNIVAFIFARGGSKGVPRKNIRPLGDKPLIAWSIATARAVEGISDVIVSTDDPEIQACAIKYGARAPFLRPPEISLDDSPEWLAWRHAIDWVENDNGQPIDLFLSIPTTSPFRSPNDIIGVIERFNEGSWDSVICVTEAQRNPYFNMVALDDAGAASLVAGQGESFRRQDTPEMFDITTVGYATSPAYIRRSDGLFKGRVGVFEVPQERSLDIDTEFDFKVAEALVTHKKAVS
jgi:CMP-N-acetylneuraminic acid synthetase